MDLFLTDPPYADVESVRATRGTCRREAEAGRAVPGVHGAVSPAEGDGGDGEAPEVLVDVRPPVRRSALCHPSPAHPEPLEADPCLCQAARQDSAELAIRPSRRRRAGQGAPRLGTGPKRGRVPDRAADRAGQLVVDPFCGGGTIPAACKTLGRRWLATEKDRTRHWWLGNGWRKCPCRRSGRGDDEVPSFTMASMTREG